MKQENFNKVKKVFEAKQNAQTKDEVDSYNKLVAKLNKSGNSYNALSLETYNRREKLINSWNNTIQVFFDKHVPKN
jgi:hypothetical protein